MADTPLLWQYNFSNYNEKARWALDHKGVRHRRRSLMPGEPRALAFSLRGTLPVLDLEGRRIVDSAAIIAELERRHPEPALYPADEGERTRALELQSYFDEEVGHALRRALFWELRDDRPHMIEFVSHGQPAHLRALMRATFPLGWIYISHRYSFSSEDAERAWATLEGALERIESQRAGGPYLVGGSFSVADLTAAALLWPLAWSPEFPYPLPGLPPNTRVEELRRHPAVAWIGEIYARHRGSSAEIG